MSLNQQLTEFRFNLETLDLLNTMGKTIEYSTQMLNELGFSATLISFMQNNRMLLNSVLLRLQLYSEQNINEQKIRSNLAMLNNSSVNTLLDYLYKTSSKKSSPPPTPVPAPKKKEVKIAEPEPEPEVEEHQEEEVEEVEEAEVEEEEVEENHFEVFFSTCVQQTDDATHVVKMSAMYDAFTKWWNNNYEDEVPSKDELKDYLSEKLGRQIKSTISNVSLA
jgi:hypothetical protein